MKKLKVAITGGIGSGKSTVLGVLHSAGYKTLSSDTIVSELYQTRKVKKLLKELFPDAVKGFFCLKIDRKKIASAVFSNEILREKLTNTITPLVLNEINERAKKLDTTVFVEVPLLFECGYQNEFDAVLVITRALNERIESVKARSNLTEQEILSRIKSHPDYDEVDLSPYNVIVNDGDLNALKEKVFTLVKNLTE